MRNDFAGGSLCSVEPGLSASSEQTFVGSLEHVWQRRAPHFAGLSWPHRAESVAVGRVEQPVAVTAAVGLFADHDGLGPALHDRLRLAGNDELGLAGLGELGLAGIGELDPDGHVEPDPAALFAEPFALRPVATVALRFDQRPVGPDEPLVRVYPSTEYFAFASSRLRLVTYNSVSVVAGIV